MFSCLLWPYRGGGGEVDIMFHLHFCSRCCSTRSVHVRAIASLYTAAAAGVASYRII